MERENFRNLLNQDPLIPANYEDGLPDTESFKIFSQKQREAIRDRDHGACQFPEHLNGHKRDCGGRLEVHHILPQGYCKEIGIVPDYPLNALTICKNAHELIHPDIADARHHWKPKSDVFMKVQEKRDKLLAEHKIYWNTEFDRAMTAQAAKNTQLAVSEGWKFPLDEGSEEVILREMLEASMENDTETLMELMARLSEMINR